MTRLSTGPLSPSPFSVPEAHVPFKIYLRADLPHGYGNRWERIRELEKQAQFIEDDILAYSEVDNCNIYIARPIAFTRQFAQFVARYTVVGNILKTDNPKEPLEQVTRINTGEARTQYGAVNSADKSPVAIVDTYARQLYNLFRSGGTIGLTNVTVLAIEVVGVRYGSGGKSIPT